MANIMLWPDVHREDGHWLPAVSLAKSLHDRNHDVRMIGIPDTAPIVEPYQIPFTEVLAKHFPFGYAQERFLETGRTVMSHLMPMARGELDDVFTGSEEPDVLVVGYFAALEALIVHHKYNLPLVVLTTFLRHPDMLPALLAKSILLDHPPTVMERMIELCAGEPMDVDEFVQPLREAPEIIPMPQAFDFRDRDWKHEAQVTYVEPMVTRLRLDGNPVPTPEVTYFHDLPEEGPLLYGVCGSQVEVFESSARQFFLNLIEMMKSPGMRERHLVLSVGVKLYQEFERAFMMENSPKKLPENVSIASWVPQQEILERAEAIFLHGGLATIKESIWAEVPIVIVPMVNDQFDNALRIEEHDLGVMVEVSSLTPERLREALAEATSSPWIRRAASRMQGIFEDEETRVPKRSVEVIESQLQV